MWKVAGLSLTATAGALVLYNTIFRHGALTVATTMSELIVAIERLQC